MAVAPGGRRWLDQPECFSLLAGCVVSISAWTVFSLGLTAALSQAAPFAALQVSGGDATIELSISRIPDEGASLGGTPGALRVPPSVRSLTSRTELAFKELRSNPLSVEAFKRLATIKRAEGDEERAIKFDREVFRRSFRESQSTAQLLKWSLNKLDLPAAVEYVDALLRAQDISIETALPIVVAIGSTPGGLVAISQALKMRPPWRQEFLNKLANYKNIDEFFLNLIDILKESGDGISSDETMLFMFDLVRRNKIDEALTVWNRVGVGDPLGSSALLYNGDFGLAINNSPFNWYISEVEGALASVVSHPDAPDRRALSVSFSGGRFPFSAVRQTMALTPGPYRLVGWYRSEDFHNVRGLVWRLYCGPSYAPKIGETVRLLGRGGRDWTSFIVEFEVPKINCLSQTLRLELAARIPQEQMASGSMWFADLRVDAR